MKLPKRHQTIMPYLMLKEAEKFGEFMKKVFQASVTLNKLREDGKTIMYSELTINGSTIMFADATEQWAPQTANLFIYVASADETYQKAIDAGATSTMGLTDQDYGRTCGVTDPFGNTWWVTSINNLKNEL